MADNFRNLGLRHFQCTLDSQRIAWLEINVTNSSINRLSAEVLHEFDRALDYLSAAPPAGLIIYSSKSSGFIAGADIDEFSDLDTSAKGEALVLRGWSIFERLANLPFATLALIHGHCLGGGLELALACKYRLLVDLPHTIVALPEVRLGIFPGWGGMKRLPEIIGPSNALNIMLTGRNVRAKQAVRMGIADGLVPERLAKQAAAQLVLSNKPARKATGLNAWLNKAPLKTLVEKRARKTIHATDPHKHYLAPRAILDIWANHDGNPLKAPDTIHQIINSDAARHLIRVFHLQERLKAFAKRTTKDPLTHVHIVGAGVMGGDIAALCASKNITVTLQDRDRERIAQAQGRARQFFERKLRNPRLVQQAFDRLIPDEKGIGIAQADLVLEAISENLHAKQQLFAMVEPQLKAGAILATNTSSIPLESLRTALMQPNRLIGIHFFNPVAMMPLVEVVETHDLDPEVRATAMAFCDQIGKLPLPVSDTPGFLVNAILAPYMLEAMRCIDEGIKPEVVDAAMVQFGMPMGPIELIDTVGLDIARDVGVQLSDTDQPPRCLQQLLDAGDLGRKTGKGFYTWVDGKAQKDKVGTVPSDLAYRLIAPLINKTQVQVNVGVVADADLADAGAIFGTGFAPFLGGPLYYKDRMHTSNNT